jgi:hypothetical protein
VSDLLKHKSKNLISATRKRLPLEQYIDGVLAGNRMVLARAITVIESDLPADVSRDFFVWIGIAQLRQQLSRPAIMLMAA